MIGLSILASDAIDDVYAGHAPGPASVEVRAAKILMDLIGVSLSVAIEATRAAMQRRGFALAVPGVPS